MIKPWFVFIESNSTGTGCIFATVARDRGYQPVVLTTDSARYSFLYQNKIAFVLTDTSSAIGIRDAVSRLEKTGPIAGVYSSSEYFVEAAAELSKTLGLPGADYHAIRECRNKFKQRRKLHEAGLVVPQFHFASTLEETLEGVKRIGLPCILKPTLGTGSVGVRLCTTAVDAEKHASVLLRRHVNERGIPVPSELLVEQYVCGPEYSVETFHGQVVGIVRKYTTPEPNFVEIGHDFPAELPRVRAQAFGDTVIQALNAVGLTWGPAHTEVRWSEGRIAIIEINPRLAGGFIPELVRLATGTDLISATLSAAVGEDFHTEPIKNDYASIRFLAIEHEGVLAGMDGLSEVSQMPYVVDARRYYGPGHVCRIRHDFRDRLGHIITAGPERGKIVDAADNALHCIFIRLDCH